VVLVPQIYHNWDRKSTEGLSLGWASMNFTASLGSLFFNFHNHLPLFYKCSAVYMPIIEFGILTQFWLYAPTKKRILGANTVAIMGISVWTSYACALFIWPSLIAWAYRFSVCLWSVETLLQVHLNSAKGDCEAQAKATVVLALSGKITDAVSAFGNSFSNLKTLDRAQIRLLAFFSSSTAFINTMQVAWMSKRREDLSEFVRAILYSSGITALCALGVMPFAMYWRHGRWWAVSCTAILTVASAIALCSPRRTDTKESPDLLESTAATTCTKRDNDSLEESFLGKGAFANEENPALWKGQRSAREAGLIIQSV